MCVKSMEMKAMLIAAHSTVVRLVVCTMHSHEMRKGNCFEVLL